MMRRIAILTATAVALTLGLAAQSAEARPMTQCTGDQPLTLGEDGGQYCGSEPFVVAAVNASNEQVTVTTEIESGDELMPLGAIIEVEIDFDEVVASLDPAVAREIYLAAVNEGGMDPAAAPSASDPVNTADVAAVITEAEMTVAANYLSSSFQNRSTGQSNPAGPNTTRRESTGEAIGRAIANWIRNPSIPGINLRYQGRTREYYPNGQLKKESPSELQIEVG
jgi:hypothetical protein